MLFVPSLSQKTVDIETVKKVRSLSGELLALCTVHNGE